MRRSSVICLVLASIDVLVFAAQLLPKEDDDLKARVVLPSKAAIDAPAGGTSVPFRLPGDTPKPEGEARHAPDRAPQNAEQIDSNSYVFLGTMKSHDGAATYFFKDISNDRVYSTGIGDGGAKILSVSEKEFLLDIEGKKYEVLR